MGRWRVACSGDRRNGSVAIRNDVDILVSQLGPGQTLTHTLRRGRGTWLHVAADAVELNGGALKEGDGAAMEDEGELSIVARETAELVLFDLR